MGSLADQYTKVMDSPFPDQHFGANGQAPTQAAPTLNQVQPKAMDFNSIANKYKFNTKSLAPNQELGKLQIMQRLQDKYGPNYTAHPEAQDILKAYMMQPQAEGQDQKMQGMVTQGKRTLGALMGP